LLLSYFGQQAIYQSSSDRIPAYLDPKWSTKPGLLPLSHKPDQLASIQPDNYRIFISFGHFCDPSGSTDNLPWSTSLSVSSFSQRLALCRLDLAILSSHVATRTQFVLDLELSWHGFSMDRWLDAWFMTCNENEFGFADSGWSS
jgi:hypothetical protein